jgi:hypothetical protein
VNLDARATQAFVDVLRSGGIAVTAGLGRLERHAGTVNAGLGEGIGHGLASPNGEALVELQ